MFLSLKQEFATRTLSIGEVRTNSQAGVNEYHTNFFAMADVKELSVVQVRHLPVRVPLSYLSLEIGVHRSAIMVSSDRICVQIFNIRFIK